jgi:hypothetical protein
VAQIEWKRGDSFAMTAAETLLQKAGQLSQQLNMKGWGIASQVRERATDELVCTLAMTWIDATIGSFVLEAKDTTMWPVGMLLLDVQYTNPQGYVSSSETISIRCKADQTR